MTKKLASVEMQFDRLIAGPVMRMPHEMYEMILMLWRLMALTDNASMVFT